MVEVPLTEAQADEARKAAADFLGTDGRPSAFERMRDRLVAARRARLAAASAEVLQDGCKRTANGLRKF
jgi:hypothetical protein